MTNQEIVAEALEAIYAQEGELTAAGVVQHAASPSHPLHAFFDWDDGSAANQFRLGQARNLIRSVKIRFMTEEEAGEVRAWHSAKRIGVPDRAGYLSDAEVKESPVASAALLRAMQREWMNLRRRWQSQAAFWEMVTVDIPHNDEAKAG